MPGVVAAVGDGVTIGIGVTVFGRVVGVMVADGCGASVGVGATVGALLRPTRGMCTVVPPPVCDTAPCAPKTTETIVARTADNLNARVC